jgi:hypothetical protein
MQTELSLRDQQLLQTFIKPKTVHQAAEQLQLSYEVTVKQVRKLIKLGLLAEMPGREGKKRTIYTKKFPGKSLENQLATHQFYWRGELQSYRDLLTELIQGHHSFSFAGELHAIVSYLWHRSLLKSQGELSSHLTPTQLKARLERAIVIAQMQIEFANEILQAPFWSDSDFVHTLIDENPSQKTRESWTKNAGSCLTRIMHDGKDVLQ